jgi:hypothetical protein
MAFKTQRSAVMMGIAERVTAVMVAATKNIAGMASINLISVKSVMMGIERRVMAATPSVGETLAAMA